MSAKPYTMDDVAECGNGDGWAVDPRRLLATVEALEAAEARATNEERVSCDLANCLLEVGEEAQKVEAERDAALARAEKAEELAYVPGQLRCAKCSCVLVTTTIHVLSGGLSPDSSPKGCPNGCGPMWRVTERQAANESIDREDRLIAQLAALRDPLVEADDWLAQAKVNAGGMGSTRRRITEALASTAEAATKRDARLKEEVRRDALERDKTTSEEMRLPDGKTCADCKWIDRCVALGYTKRENACCDFWPNRFRAATTTEPQ